MRQRRNRAGWALAIVATLVAVEARGQTVIIDSRPVIPNRNIRPPRGRLLRDARLQIKNHGIDVTITDGVAETRIDQVFFNEHDRVVEGTYIFPLEDDIALGKFSMFVNGEEIEGKLLPVEEARQVYESIVARMRDPALLEYLGTKMIRARIFPINPKSEVRIKLSYTQALKTRDGLVRYRYPLGTEKHHTAPVDAISVMVDIQSKAAIKSVFSPSHKVAVSRPSDQHAMASFEASNVQADKDFELFYTLGSKEFGMTVLTYRKGGEDGYFIARVAPPARAAHSAVLPKDVTFVIDTSGSMAGEKMDQAREALKFCLSNLNAADRFNVIPFSHEPLLFRDVLVAASPDIVAEARKFVDGLEATGGTNINDALLAALEVSKHAETPRPHLVVFLTDGKPTIGIADTKEILKNISQRSNDRTRLFVFGVGYDVNSDLLDILAEQNSGTSDYVEPGEDLELRLSSFYRTIAEPVLSKISLTFGNLGVYDLYPPKLGDLFAGHEVVVTGRFKGTGDTAVELSGTRGGERERHFYESSFPSDTRVYSFLPRLWATRKVGFLLDQIRLHGENQELKDTVVQLAATHGIVTPYTAYLVTEPGAVAREGAGRRQFRQALRQSSSSIGDVAADQDMSSTMQPAPGGATTPSSRRARVRYSKSTRRMKAAQSLPAPQVALERDASVSQRAVAHVDSRTFYRVGDRWIDADYDQKGETTKIEMFSKAYFEWLRKHPDLGRCFALGDRVIVVVSDGAVVEVVPATDAD